MNSLAADCKIEYILWYYECLQLDVLFLSDTRLSKLQVDLFKQRAHSRLGADTKIFSSLSKKSLDKKCNVGGQIVIVRPNWAQHVVKAQGDHTGLGLVMEVDIRLKDSKLKILGSYWPCRSNSENGLWSAVAKHLTNAGLDSTGDAVSDYVKQLTGNKILKHMEDGKNSCIAGGDFNAGWKLNGEEHFVERSHHLFKQWAIEHGMVNDVVELYDNGVFTYKRDENIKTLIDHVMNSVLNTEFIKGGCSQSLKWQKDTDHRPVWIAIKLRDGKFVGTNVHGYEFKKVRRVELDLDDVVANQALQDLMLKLTGDYEDEFDLMDVEQIRDMTLEICKSISNGCTAKYEKTVQR